MKPASLWHTLRLDTMLLVTYGRLQRSVSYCLPYSFDVLLTDPKFIHVMLQRVRRSCKRMAQKLNCISAPDAFFAAAEPSHGPSRTTSSSRRTPVHHGHGGGTRSTTGTSSRTRTPSASASRAGSDRGKRVASPSPSPVASDGNNSEDEDPTYGAQELGMSQIFDAPPPTQGESSQVKFCYRPQCLHL